MKKYFTFGPNRNLGKEREIFDIAKTDLTGFKLNVLNLDDAKECGGSPTCARIKC